MDAASINDSRLAALAEEAAAAATGRKPREVRRFRTGTAHRVFEVLFDDQKPVVVRLGEPKRRVAMIEGVRLHECVRGFGVPLPAVLAAKPNGPLPLVVLERLPGTDLGEVIGSLSDDQQRDIANGVAAAQAAVTRIGSAGRYGYAVAPESAPHVTWSAVLGASLARSRERIEAARLFTVEPVDRVAALLATRLHALEPTPATAFLHDTTTKNVIVTSLGTLSGIVDVDDVCFGDPRYAPALTMAALLACNGPVAYVRHWMEAAGFREDAVFRLYVATFLLDFMGEHGQSFNGNEHPSTARSRDSLSAVFEAAIERAETD